MQKLGTDEEIFRQILCTRSMSQVEDALARITKTHCMHLQLAATIDEYKKRTGHDLEYDIRKEFSDDVRDGLLAIGLSFMLFFFSFNCQLFSVRIAKSPTQYFAERLNLSLKGVATDDDTLIRVIVSRSEVRTFHH